MTTLTLVSHNLCPYVQRAAIALSEKRIPFERRDIDLAKKPEWFKRISPLGKVPLLQVKSGSTQEPILPIRLSPTPTICSVSPWTAGKGRRRRIEEAIRLILDCSEIRIGV